MTILITGARGKVGRAVLDRLQAAGHAVRAASKSPADLDVPVETVELDLTNPATFDAALAGVSQVFLYPEPDGIHALIESMRSAGVKHVVLLSSSSVLAPGADTDPLAHHSLLVERALASLTCTILRPDAFASNAFGWSYFIGAQLPVPLAYPGASVASIHTDDLADIATAALTGDALTGRAFTLTGAESLTFHEQLAVIGRLLGREIVVEEITRAEAEQQMGRFMPAPMAGALLDLWSAATAGPAAIGDTTQTLLGVPARTFEQWVAEHLAAFQH